MTTQTQETKMMSKKTWTTQEALSDAKSYRLVHTYRISNRDSGQDLGTFLGRGPAHALDEMARDAGYADYTDCCAQVGGANLIIEDLGL